MGTLRSYLAREIYGATLFVFVGFLALFAFFDLIHELGDLGKGGYRLQHALLFVVLSVPSHVYELFPVAVLIGSLYTLAHLAGNSEFTAMRASGMSPAAAGMALARIGASFVVLTFVVGELVTPVAERTAQQLKLQATSSAVVQEFRTGMWVKDESRFVNVREVRPDASLADVRIYDFDEKFRLRSISSAAAADYSGGNRWVMHDVVQTLFGADGTSVRKLAQMDWQSVLNPEILSVLFVMPERMSAWNLYLYSRHLGENRQRAVRYEIAMWKKLLYPFAALVMMALALPFAYVQARSGGVGLKVFAGIMLGVFFHMLNSLFSHLGLLQGWAPAVSAALPSLMFLAAAVVMMWWVERR